MSFADKSWHQISSTIIVEKGYFSISLLTVKIKDVVPLFLYRVGTFIELEFLDVDLECGGGSACTDPSPIFLEKPVYSNGTILWPCQFDRILVIFLHDNTF